MQIEKNNLLETIQKEIDEQEKIIKQKKIIDFCLDDQNGWDFEQYIILNYYKKILSNLKDILKQSQNIKVSFQNYLVDINNKCQKTYSEKWNTQMTFLLIEFKRKAILHFLNKYSKIIIK